MKFYLFIFVFAFVSPISVKSFLIRESPEDNTVDNGSSDQSTDDSTPGVGIYRVLHQFYSPYLKKVMSKGRTPDEANRRKREGNHRKPMMLKRQVNVRKPILMLNEEGPNENVIRTDETEAKREVKLKRKISSVVSSVPFPDDEENIFGPNELDSGIVARSDKARRPILVNP